MKERLLKKIRRLFSDKRAISSVLSSVLLASVVLSLGFGVQYYVYWRSIEYNNQYGALVDESIAKLREKLVFEHIFYDTDNNSLAIYLMNCGKINDASIDTVSISNETWNTAFYEVELMSLDDGEPTDGLDILDEGYFELTVGLVDDTSYTIFIITGRGKAFATSFTA